MGLRPYETRRIRVKDKLYIYLQCNNHENTHVVAMGKFPYNCPEMAINVWMVRAKEMHSMAV